jgi:hypothetical protein
VRVLERWQACLGDAQDRRAARDAASAALTRAGVPSAVAARALGLLDGWRAFAPAARPVPRRKVRRALHAWREALGDPDDDAATTRDTRARVP